MDAEKRVREIIKKDWHQAYMLGYTKHKEPEPPKAIDVAILSLFREMMKEAIPKKEPEPTPYTEHYDTGWNKCIDQFDANINQLIKGSGEGS